MFKIHYLTPTPSITMQFTASRKHILSAYILLGLIFTGLLYFWGTYLYAAPPLSTSFYWLSLSLILVIVIFIIGYLDTKRYKLIVHEQAIEEQSLFGGSTLAFHEIKGFRVMSNWIVIVPVQANKKVIKVAGLENMDLFINWLIDEFNNLDEQDIIDEEKEILSNLDFGTHETERDARWQQAKMVSKVLNGIGIAAGIWLFFFPEPYTLAIVMNGLIPLYCIVAILYFRGLIRLNLNDKERSAYPTIFMGILLPSAALSLRALMDIDVVDHSMVWLPITLAGVGLAGIALVGTKEVDFKGIGSYIAVLGLGLLFSAYSYGLLISTNVCFDDSKSLIHEVQIIDKKVEGGKVDTYHLVLSAWGSKPEGSKISVSKAQYDQLEIGTSINIYQQAGYWNIPWIFTPDESSIDDKI